jgi:hypothetical protein
MSLTSSSSVTPAFIDLASFDDSEKYMYSLEGMPDYKDAAVYFIRETRKSTWFTQIPVILPQTQGNCDFGSNWSVSVSRNGDYLLNTWLRMSLPVVELTGPASVGDFKTIRWTQNLAHALIKEVSFTSNDLEIAKFDNYHLDFWTAFTIPAGKQEGYIQMIGNTDLINPKKEKIPVAILNLPLPFFFSRDKGLALPTAALPYTDMKINFTFRDWTELLIIDEFDEEGGTGTYISSRPVEQSDLVTTPHLTSVQVWGTYAIVPNEERKKMACSVRDMLIEQAQTATIQTFVPEIEPVRSFNLRFSHPIKVFFFACRNTTIRSQWSNYTAASPIPDPIALGQTRGFLDLDGELMNDPISLISLVYENANRLSKMGADYFSLVNPFFNAPVIPLNTGYHCYSYSLDFINLDPMGSTNHAKLNNVSLEICASETVLATTKPYDINVNNKNNSEQKFEFIATAVNNNILRVSSGILVFPYL